MSPHAPLKPWVLWYGKGDPPERGLVMLLTTPCSTCWWLGDRGLWPHSLLERRRGPGAVVATHSCEHQLVCKNDELEAPTVCCSCGFCWIWFVSQCGCVHTACEWPFYPALCHNGHSDIHPECVWKLLGPSSSSHYGLEVCLWRLLPLQDFV